MTLDHNREWYALLRAAQIWLVVGDPATALTYIADALPHANRLSPRHRSATLRILNWTRAAARRSQCSAS